MEVVELLEVVELVEVVVELEKVVEVVEVVEGLIIHIGRAGRRDSNQQKAIPNFIFRRLLEDL